MTGINSYSTTAASNVTANTGINWDEGMSPSAVNNSARQNMADTRAAFNDLIWFKYGKGDLDYSPVYASSTSFTVAGIDVTAIYHAGRRVKAVGSGTGTIYGSISSSSFSTNTTVNVTWDSGSLSNEIITVYIAQVPVTGDPVHPDSIAWSATNDSATAGSVGEYISVSVPTGSEVTLSNNVAANVASISLTAGDWDVEGTVLFDPTSATVTDAIEWTSTTSATVPTPPNNGGLIHAALNLVSSSSGFGYPIGRQRFSLNATTTVYMSCQCAFSGTLKAYGFLSARRVR